MIRRDVFFIGALLILAAAAVAQSDRVIVRPVEIHDVLVNPGMGITTFGRFNGDPSRPGFPDTSIAYFRWYWEALEPEHGKMRWEMIDNALEQARLHNQTLAIRLMPHDAKHPLPEWYRNSGARRANKPGEKGGEVWEPDFSDPLYLKYWGELVAAAGRRYDGHPYLDSVDISSIGYWGEGWSDYMPAWPHQKALIDIYPEAFRGTPLLMNFDAPEALAYGAKGGAGWRLDCVGDMGAYWESWHGFLSHMLDVYPQQIVRTGIQDVWQRSPVSLETCWVPGYWKEKNWDVNYILDQALRWHVSSLNIKSSPIPPEWKKQFEEFQKRIGYRFVLRRLEYERSVKAGRMTPIHMWWLNAGVAPVYRGYRLAVQFLSPSASAVTPVPADARKWLPGDAVFDGTIYVPDSLKAGTYRLRIALLDPRSEQPAIRLAIEGRQPDGWYDLGSIEVQ